MHEAGSVIASLDMRFLRFYKVKRKALIVTRPWGRACIPKTKQSLLRRSGSVAVQTGRICFDRINIERTYL
jgi:hypothetical protein